MGYSSNRSSLASTVLLAHCGKQQSAHLGLVTQALPRLGSGPDLPPLTGLWLPPRLPTPLPASLLMLMPLAGPKVLSGLQGGKACRTGARE